MGQARATASARQGRGGRRLDSARNAVFRRAVLELLAEVGYERLTMEAVASRARTSKPTLYRRWAGKAELVVDALDDLKGGLAVPDTGSLRGDLHSLAESIVSPDSRLGAQVTIGMVNALARDHDLRRVFTSNFVSPRTTVARAIFERAVARGEMPEGHDLDLLARLLPALALQQLVTTGELPDVRFAADVVDEVIHPLAVAPLADPRRHEPVTTIDEQGRSHRGRG